MRVYSAGLKFAALDYPPFHLYNKNFSLQVVMRWVVAFLLLIYGFSYADIVQITKDDFDDTVAQLTVPLIIDVNATWCNPCRMMEPIIDELSDEYGGKVQFGKIDYDSQGDLVKKFKVSSLPTILFFKNGQKTPAMRHVGFMSKEEFENKIELFLKK